MVGPAAGIDVSRVFNMQARRAANRSARREYAMNGPVTVVSDRSQENAYLEGYFKVLDGHEVSLKDLPRWKSDENLVEYRAKLWDFNPYLAGAWTATRALKKGLDIKGYKGRVSPPCELERLDEELRRREAADIWAMEEGGAFMRVIRQDA